jgi:predicted RNA-binding protein Jag
VQGTIMAQRFEGRNLEDALQTATQSLGVDRWQLTYRVLLEKRGFLGGVKRGGPSAGSTTGAIAAAAECPGRTARARTAEP